MITGQEKLLNQTLPRYILRTCSKMREMLRTSIFTSIVSVVVSMKESEFIISSNGIKPIKPFILTALHVQLLRLLLWQETK